MSVKRNVALVTGSSGLIGSEVVDYFCGLGWEVHGVDNNMRADFFGPGGDTRWDQRRLLAAHRGFHHHEIDIRDRAGVDALVAALKPALTVQAHLFGRPLQYIGYGGLGKQVRDVLHIEDLADLVLETAASCSRKPVGVPGGRRDESSRTFPHGHARSAAVWSLS